MTSRERVLAAVNRKIPDRVPKDLSWGLCPALVEEFHKRTSLDDYEEFFGLDTRILEFAPGRMELDYSGYYQGRNEEPGFSINEWGVGIGKSKDSALHFEHIISPLKFGMSEKEAHEYPLPDYLEEYRYAGLKSKTEQLHQKGLAVCGNLTQTIFEKAWSIRGFEETLMDMLSEPEAITILFDRIMQLRIGQMKHYLDADVDILMLGDDVGMQTGMLLGKELWRAFLKPRLAHIITEAKKLRQDIPIFYHSCGNISEIIPELIEIGVTVLNPIQPECIDLLEVKELYGDKIAFWGGVSAQSNLSFGSPEDVRAEVKNCMEKLGINGGYLIGPNHMVEPEVSWENLCAFFEAVKEYGNYEETV